MTRPKVLLVDDNASVLDMLQTSLERYDFEIVPAKDVGEALQQISAQHFDVLITDLHMPNPEDGCGVVRAMRQTQPEAFILVMSGFPDAKEDLATPLREADEVLIKPFEMKQLVELIRTKRRGAGNSR